MKTSKIFMTTLVALTMVACSNDNDWVDQSSNPDVIAPDAYASFSINIPHASKTRAVSTDPGIAAENAVKSLHVFIYDAESPNTPTVAEFTVAGGTLTQKPAGSSTWMTSQPISTKKTDKYIFAGVNLNTEIVNYITSNGLGAFSYKDFTQEITKLADQTNGFVMFNSAYPTLTPAADLYEKKSEAENNHITISVNRVTAKAAVFQSQSFVVNGGGTMTDLKFGWRNLNKKFYFIQDNRDTLSSKTIIGLIIPQKILRGEQMPSTFMLRLMCLPLFLMLRKMHSSIFRVHPMWMQQLLSVSAGYLHPLTSYLPKKIPLQLRLILKSSSIRNRRIKHSLSCGLPMVLPITL